MNGILKWQIVSNALLRAVRSLPSVGQVSFFSKLELLEQRYAAKNSPKTRLFRPFRSAPPEKQQLENDLTLFVGGLSKYTTDDLVEDYFSDFGKIVKCVVKMDSATNQSRGFGYVTFSSSEEVSHVLDSGPHEIDGREASVKPYLIDGKPERGKQYSDERRAMTYPPNARNVRPFRRAPPQKQFEDNHLKNANMLPVQQSENGLILYVGGLSADTTKESLQDYFSEFRDELKCVVKMDSATNQSRGFGYVTFSSLEEIRRVLDAGPHEIDGKMANVELYSDDGKPAQVIPYSDQKRVVENNPKTRDDRPLRSTSPVGQFDNDLTLFVGGLSKYTTDDLLGDYFSNFGKIVKCVVKMDSATNQSRGFGYVTFSNSEEVSHVLDSGPHMVDGRQARVKPYLDDGKLSRSKDERSAINNRPQTKNAKPVKSEVMLEQVKDDRILFVRCLSDNTTEEMLQDYFSKFGDTPKCVVAMDSRNRSRCFGNVTFSSPEEVLHVLDSGPHKLDGSTMSVMPYSPKKLAAKNSPKERESKPKQQLEDDLTLFVGGLSSDTTDESLQDYFSEFGNTRKCVVKMDSATNESRGFGYVTFSSPEEARRVLDSGSHEIDGRTAKVMPYLDRRRTAEKSGYVCGGARKRMEKQKERVPFRR